MATENETAIEKKIVAKGHGFPRLSPELIDSVIINAHYARGSNIEWDKQDISGVQNGPTVALSCLTICTLTLKNGYTVTGTSGCVHPDAYDFDIGCKAAYNKARDQIWALEGYLLREKLYREGDVAATWQETFLKNNAIEYARVNTSWNIATPNVLKDALDQLLASANDACNHAFAAIGGSDVRYIIYVGRELVTQLETIGSFEPVRDKDSYAQGFMGTLGRYFVLSDAYREVRSLGDRELMVVITSKTTKTTPPGQPNIISFGAKLPASA
jgi:hypothetical protein